MDDPTSALKHILSMLIDVALRTPDQILRRRSLAELPELEQEVFYALLDDPNFPLKRVRDGFHVSDAAALICHAATTFDLQQLSIKLTWQEFEKLVTNALEMSEFKVVKNFHFTGARKKRWEVDVIGIRGSLLIALDAKHWTRTTQAPSALEKAATNQKTRIAALAQEGGLLGDLLFQLGVTQTHLTLVPAVVTLFDPPFELAQAGIPALSIRTLSYFLQHIDAILPKIWTTPASPISLQRRLL